MDLRRSPARSQEVARVLPAAVAALLLALAPAARAGGDFVDLAAGRAVWAVGPFGVRAFDAATGRVLYAPRPVAPEVPTSVAVAGGAAWVASVENGFAGGRLTRIDLRTHRPRVVYHAAAGAVEYVAAGGGSVYALVGFRAGNRILRFASSGRATGSWNVGDGGRMAADASGCWISAENRLLHVDRSGRLRVAARVPFGDVATGVGSVWVGLRDSVIRVDERSGRTRTLATERLRLGGFQHDLAVGDGRLWTLRVDGGARSALEERRLDDGRVLRTKRIVGMAKALAVRPDAVWVATGDTLLRLDRRTLRPTLSVPLL